MYMWSLYINRWSILTIWQWSQKAGCFTVAQCHLAVYYFTDIIWREGAREDCHLRHCQPEPPSEIADTSRWHLSCTPLATTADRHRYDVGRWQRPLHSPGVEVVSAEVTLEALMLRLEFCMQGWGVGEFKYSRSYLERPPHGPHACGLSREVVSGDRFSYIEM